MSTVEGFQSATPGSGASGSLVLSTSLLSTDLVVVVYMRMSTGVGTLTINGSSPTIYSTWTNNTVRVQVSTVTGLTGSHTLSYTMSASASNLVGVYVVRGLTDVSITATSESTWLSTTDTPANTEEAPSAVSVDNAQVVIAVGAATTGGAITFPTNPSPASGWTSDVGGSSRAHLAHQAFTGPASAQVGVQCASAADIAALMLVLGDPDSVPPLTSTFIGWGNPVF